MNIKFLGSGSAWVLAEENYHSNVIFDINGTKLLYDCGTTIPESLNEAGYKVEDIDLIFISHLHADHAGGIEYMGFKRYFEQFPFGKEKSTLIGTKEVLNNGWKHTWSGGMSSLSDKKAELKDFFNAISVRNFFMMGETKVEVVETDHAGEMKSYGLFFNTDKKVFITGDTTYDNSLFGYYERADIIFHDCEFAEYDNSVHAQYRFLKELPEEIKSKMWLYHYSLKGEHIWTYDKIVEGDGFAGIVRKGQEFKNL